MKKSIFIGFERDLTGLGSFLNEHGYIPTEYYGQYKPLAKDWPKIHYVADIKSKQEAEEEYDPDWRRARNDIVSQLTIIFDSSDFDSESEAHNLVRLTARKFEGVIYDEDFGQFMMAEDW